MIVCRCGYKPKDLGDWKRHTEQMNNPRKHKFRDDGA